MRNTTKSTAPITCSAGASAFAKSGAPGGTRVVVSVMAGIQWKKKVAE